MMETIQLRGRLSGHQRMRLVKLLDMLYTPAEIAAEIGFARRQFYRVYFPAGCPDSRDGNGHHWVNGKQFARWYFENYKKVTLSADEVFCLTCKRPVPLRNPETRQKGYLIYLFSDCPNCGRCLVKFLKHAKEVVT